MSPQPYGKLVIRYLTVMREKKSFYMPGLISALGLLILLLVNFPVAIRQKTCIRIFLPSDERHRPGIFRFSKWLVFEQIRNKRMVNIELNDRDWDNMQPFLSEEKQRFITRQMEWLAFTQDTCTVLKVNFGAQCTYGQFVSVINKTLIFHIRRFALVDNNLYIFANPPIAAQTAS